MFVSNWKNYVVGNLQFTAKEQLAKVEKMLDNDDLLSNDEELQTSTLTIINDVEFWNKYSFAFCDSFVNDFCLNVTDKI